MSPANMRQGFSNLSAVGDKSGTKLGLRQTPEAPESAAALSLVDITGLLPWNINLPDFVVSSC